MTMEQGFSAMPKRDEQPRSEQIDVIENILGVLSQEAVDLYNALPLMATQAEYEEGIEQFNTLGAAQLDRIDAGRKAILEKETLDSRQMETVITLPPYGRTLRITRSGNGIVTLASA